MILNIIEYLRTRLGLLIRISWGVLILLLIFDALLLDKTKAHTWAEKLPGFWALFGFLSCVVIIFLSKWYGKLGITKHEEYYD
ncbi:MAG: hypothetical protein HQK66_01555 [Desulfamplus sp.]|nr:hypothetical protein [Desulfamplus sp.]